MKKRSYVNFLPDICKAAGCKHYTEHYLKTTAIQAMNDAGFKARDVNHFSGHRNEASISTCSYNRLLSSTPPKSDNATLSTITTASVNKNNISEDSFSANNHSLQIVPYISVKKT